MKQPTRVLVIGWEDASGWQELLEDCDVSYCSVFEESGLGGMVESLLPRGLKVYKTLGEAISLHRPEAAFLCVPNTCKNRVVVEEALLKAGIPVMEIKFRLDKTEDFDDLESLSGTNGAALYVGEGYRYRGTAKTVRDFVNSGNLGRIEEVSYRCGLMVSPVCPWEKSYRDLSIEDLAFHHLSCLMWMLPFTPATVFGRSDSPAKGAPATGTVSVLEIGTREGIAVHHSINWHSAMKHTGYWGEVVIEGDKGGLIASEEGVFVRSWEDPLALRALPVDEPEVKSAYRDFLRFIKEGFPSERIAPISDYRALIEVLYGGIRSAREWAVVALPMGKEREV